MLTLGSPYQVNFSPRPSDNEPVPGGRITFGGKNTQDCSDKWVALQSEAGDWDWSLSLSGYDAVCISEKAFFSIFKHDVLNQAKYEILAIF